ncbi:MAG: MopE-related protein, partial [Nanoarchaeota archaeon]|nr:MopE-related protein [Nanoarchaeota archaeon]
TSEHGYNSFSEDLSREGLILLPKTGYNLIRINNFTDWIHFLGIWGEAGTLPGTSGPNSPANIQYPGQPNRWDHPLEFAENARPHEIIGTTGSPVNLHAYDKEGRHTGLIDSGDIEAEIPGTYLYVPSDDGKELIVILTNEEITFIVEATGEGEFNFSVSAYDRDTSSDINLYYENVIITEDTIARLDVKDTNPDFIMQIDQDGDGIIETTVGPDDMTIEGNYTNPEIDSDNDGLADSIDNCPSLYNPNQITDFDNDGFDNVLCNGLDCNDNNALVNPDAIEECNNMDDNCNNEIDENLIIEYGSDIGACEFGIKTCINGNYTITEEAIEPKEEICNNIDDNCDGILDDIKIIKLKGKGNFVGDISTGTKGWSVNEEWEFKFESEIKPKKEDYKVEGETKFETGKKKDKTKINGKIEEHRFFFNRYGYGFDLIGNKAKLKDKKDNIREDLPFMLRISNLNNSWQLTHLLGSKNGSVIDYDIKDVDDITDDEIEVKYACKKNKNDKYSKSSKKSDDDEEDGD